MRCFPRWSTYLCAAMQAITWCRTACECSMLKNAVQGRPATGVTAEIEGSPLLNPGSPTVVTDASCWTVSALLVSRFPTVTTFVLPSVHRRCRPCGASMEGGEACWKYSSCSTAQCIVDSFVTRWDKQSETASPRFQDSHDCLHHSARQRTRIEDKASAYTTITGLQIHIRERLSA